MRKTPTGQPSTAEDVLEELAESYALPRIILEHRALAKLKSTYTDKLPEQINERTGRVHTSYHQAVAATGRLSSADPNLQNIPIRTPGRAPHPPGVHRAAGLRAAGRRLLADRAAHHGAPVGRCRPAGARSPSDQDIHQATAAEVFGVALDAVTADQRRSAKAINFGLIYGMSRSGSRATARHRRAAPRRSTSSSISRAIPA